MMSLKTAQQMSNLFQAVATALEKKQNIYFRLANKPGGYDNKWQFADGPYAPRFMGMLNGAFEFSIDNVVYRID